MVVDGPGQFVYLRVGKTGQGVVFFEQQESVFGLEEIERHGGEAVDLFAGGEDEVPVRGRREAASEGFDAFVHVVQDQEVGLVVDGVEPAHHFVEEVGGVGEFVADAEVLPQAGGADEIEQEGVAGRLRYPGDVAVVVPVGLEVGLGQGGFSDAAESVEEQGFALFEQAPAQFFQFVGAADDGIEREGGDVGGEFFREGGGFFFEVEVVFDPVADADRLGLDGGVLYDVFLSRHAPEQGGEHAREFALLLRRDLQQEREMGGPELFEFAVDVAGIGGVDADIGMAGLVDHEVVTAVDGDGAGWIGHFRFGCFLLA